jgi:hypothetical protein
MNKKDLFKKIFGKTKKEIDTNIQSIDTDSIYKTAAYPELGTTDVTDIRLGTTQIKQIKLGTTSVYDVSESSGGSAPMTQSQTGGYSWLGDGSASNKFRLTGQGANPQMRGDAHSPYHSGWNSSNAPKWTINTAGTLNISRTGWSSSDDESDHQIYKNGSLALTLSYDNTSTSTLSVAANDVIEYRGAQFGNYTSDTYIVNPEFWVS